MSTETSDTTPAVRITADPGICGFPCTISAMETDKRMVAVAVDGCECEKIERLSSTLTGMSLKDVFKPITRNPVYMAAEQSGCHPSCTIPAAILKAAEVALGLALPMDVGIQFLKSGTID